MEEGLDDLAHYYKKGAPGEKVLIPYVFRGHTLQFVSYSSLFSSRRVDEGTDLLLQNIKIPSSGIVLDVGCGYGVIGISIAKAEPNIRVYMVDVNPLAVKTSRLNARLNGVEDRVLVYQGDSYEPFKGLKFNAIYSNPPLSAGMDTVKKIVLGAVDYLDRGGWAQFVLAKGGDMIYNEARSIYSRVERVSKKGYTLLYVEP
ncbi:class I SAM-dependent methyltransferase [Thermogladius sp. 4427co]|uniref:class I SAM-dependent methyltransferase n=1 Tax=Thermogladius sp. 4427co TaxID=3450718 RepID=UPI003F78B515